jgi:putative hemolysin
MVHAFDVLKAGGERQPAGRPVATAAPETPCTDLLFQMLRARRHLAIVHDANARTIGLVTLEDLLEELVGDIRDEYDEPESPAVRG